MMFRHLLLAFLGLAVSFVASSAPVPRESDERLLYYPTSVGIKRIYEAAGITSVEVITAVEEKEGTRFVTVGRETQNEIIEDRKLAVSRNGISMVDSSTASLDEPFLLLKLPCENTVEWNVTLSLRGIDKAKGKMKASRAENVKVPAGTFNAIRVEMDIAFSGERKRRTTWYAPSIGEVKVETEGKVKVLKAVIAKSNP